MSRRLEALEIQIIQTDADNSDSDNESSDDNVTADHGILTITKEGTYVVTGNLTEGQIRVETTDTEKVQLVLNDVTINNSSQYRDQFKRFQLQAACFLYP